MKIIEKVKSYKGVYSTKHFMPRRPNENLDISLSILLQLILVKLYAAVLKPKRKNIFFFNNFYHCNTKYVFEKLSHLDHVFYISPYKKELNKYKSSKKHIYQFSFRAIPKIAKAKTWCYASGSGFPKLIHKELSKCIKINLWHGVPFLNSPGQFKNTEDTYYFSPSKFMSQVYIEEWKSNKDKVLLTTGYPRNDILCKVNPELERHIKDKLNILSYNKIILYAPTWKQRHKEERPLFPWDEERIIDKIQTYCKANNYLFLIKGHPQFHYNDEYDLSLFPNVTFLDDEMYSDTQEVLCISDMLITDWSSIANDYLVLNRPIIFLNVDPNCPKLILKQEDRVGNIANNFHEMLAYMRKNMINYEDKSSLNQTHRKEVLTKCFDMDLTGTSGQVWADKIVELNHINI
jgi:CDP-glycerol glycerophosphotransferase (TagB/SpsB family)